MADFFESCVIANTTSSFEYVLKSDWMDDSWSRIGTVNVHNDNDEMVINVVHGDMNTYQPLAEVKVPSFSMEYFIKMNEAIAVGEMSKAVNCARKCMDEDSMSVTIKGHDQSTKAQANMEYPTLDYISKNVPGDQMHDWILLNPSVGTIRRWIKIFPHITPKIMVTPQEAETDYIDKLERQGWGYTISDEFDSNKVYYCGFSLQNLCGKPQHYFGYEINPKYALHGKLPLEILYTEGPFFEVPLHPDAESDSWMNEHGYDKKMDLVSLGGRVRMTSDRSTHKNYMYHEYYEVDVGDYRYCPDYLSEKYRTLSTYQNMIVPLCFNVRTNLLIFPDKDRFLPAKKYPLYPDLYYEDKGKMFSIYDTYVASNDYYDSKTNEEMKIVYTHPELRIRHNHRNFSGRTFTKVRARRLGIFPGRDAFIVTYKGQDDSDLISRKMTSTELDILMAELTGPCEFYVDSEYKVYDNGIPVEVSVSFSSEYGDFSIPGLKQQRENCWTGTVTTSTFSDVCKNFYDYKSSVAWGIISKGNQVKFKRFTGGRVVRSLSGSVLPSSVRINVPIVYYQNVVKLTNCHEWDFSMYHEGVVSGAKRSQGRI